MFRGGFNRATRAPNLGEMFLNLQQVFGAGGTFGDPCFYFVELAVRRGWCARDQSARVARQPLLASGQTAAGARAPISSARRRWAVRARGRVFLPAPLTSIPRRARRAVALPGTTRSATRTCGRKRRTPTTLRLRAPVAVGERAAEEHVVHGGLLPHQDEGRDRAVFGRLRPLSLLRQADRG